MQMRACSWGELEAAGTHPHYRARQPRTKGVCGFPCTATIPPWLRPLPVCTFRLRPRHMRARGPTADVGLHALTCARPLTHSPERSAAQPLLRSIGAPAEQRMQPRYVAPSRGVSAQILLRIASHVACCSFGMGALIHVVMLALAYAYKTQRILLTKSVDSWWFVDHTLYGSAPLTPLRRWPTGWSHGTPARPCCAVPPAATRSHSAHSAFSHRNTLSCPQHALCPAPAPAARCCCVRCAAARRWASIASSSRWDRAPALRRMAWRRPLRSRRRRSASASSRPTRRSTGRPGRSRQPTPSPLQSPAMAACEARRWPCSAWPMPVRIPSRSDRIVAPAVLGGRFGVRMVSARGRLTRDGACGAPVAHNVQQLARPYHSTHAATWRHARTCACTSLRSSRILGCSGGARRA